MGIKEYKNALLKARGSKYLFAEPKVKPVVPARQDDSLNRLVYSPNSMGWPCNDIQVMNETTNPQVKMALERRNQPLPELRGTEDDDVALDSVQQYGESTEHYVERLEGYAKEAQDSLESTSEETE